MATPFVAAFGVLFILEVDMKATVDINLPEERRPADDYPTDGSTQDKIAFALAHKGIIMSSREIKDCILQFEPNISMNTLSSRLSILRHNDNGVVAFGSISKKYALMEWLTLKETPPHIESLSAT